MSDFWIILTGCLAAISCGLLGCFLILRKMAMIGDAISHAVLPGIVIAFLFSGSLNSFPMLIGAASFGLLTTFLIELFNKKGGLQKDASIGITFTWLFAVGVILISLYADNVHIDQDCVLFGEIAYVALEPLTSLLPGISAPNTVWILGTVMILVIAMIVFGYKGLFLTTFDPSFAATIGVSTVAWHYLLMSAVSVTTVVSFESVGAILVVALLIAPAATAYLLTDQLPKMLIIAALAGIIASIGGYYLAVWLDASVAAAIATVLGIEFTLVFLFAPKNGIIIKKFIK
ncbi:MAG: iron ABC transporter [Flavobacteriales bacterium]|nr:MAG: iron ABC transporter [Flavobacteriales bacterium]